tara:strand:+ start:36 stop:407 length:372 start_codon:yes stop_codon:yes gene_type:complete
MSSKLEIKKLSAKYNAKYYLKLINNIHCNKSVINEEYVIIDGKQWPKKIYYDNLPPNLNNIVPSKHTNKYVYNICSTTIGIHLNSPRYEIVEINTDNSSSDLYEIRDDIRSLINIVANMNKCT